MERIKFGDKVECSMKYITYCNKLNKLNKVWKKVTFKCTGIFLGYRNIYEGSISFNFDLYDGGLFKRTKKITAGLVCYNEHINPIYVPTDSIELIKYDYPKIKPFKSTDEICAYCTYNYPSDYAFVERKCNESCGSDYRNFQGIDVIQGSAGK